MRRLTIAILVAGVGAVALPSSAAASFDHHFTVIDKTVSAHRTNDHGFVFKDVFLNKFDHSDRVGRLRGECHPGRDDKVKCRFFAHLSGEVGGFGDLYGKGNLGGGDQSVLVTNGTDDFNGVAGKVTNRRHDRLHFALVR
jgi:hypothetical protein